MLFEICVYVRVIDRVFRTASCIVLVRACAINRPLVKQGRYNATGRTRVQTYVGRSAKLIKRRTKIEVCICI